MAFKMKGWSPFTKPDVAKTVKTTEKLRKPPKGDMTDKQKARITEMMGGKRGPEGAAKKEYVPQSEREFDYVPQRVKREGAGDKEGMKIIKKRDPRSKDQKTQRTAFKKEKPTYKGPEEFEGPGGYAKNTGEVLLDKAKGTLDKARDTKVGQLVEKAIKRDPVYRGGKKLLEGGKKLYAKYKARRNKKNMPNDDLTAKK